MLLDLAVSVFKKSFHHRKEELSYNRGTKRFIPCDNTELNKDTYCDSRSTGHRRISKG